jgi:hypothetical protein
MKQRKLIYAAIVSVLAGALAAAAQEKGDWMAESSTAKSITGDVAFSTYKIAINFSSYTIAQIRELEPNEIKAAFDAENPAPRSGNLYRLDIPATKHFVHHNTLCGSQDTQWVATWVSGRSLQLAFFSGEKMPVFTPDAIANSTNLCGTFSYAR